MQVVYANTKIHAWLDKSFFMRVYSQGDTALRWEIIGLLQLLLTIIEGRIVK